MKTVLKITLGIVLGSILLFAGCAALIGGTADDSKPGTPVSQAADDTVDEPASTETTAPAKPKAKPKPTKKAEPTLTAGQENAIGSAENYLSYSAFSRTGLIEQLEFEGYSTKDATFGVDSLKADWNKQAAKAAKQYLDYTSFSRSGLIEQLEFDGYSRGQAEYGVDQAGL